jgi:hypothetical protein
MVACLAQAGRYRGSPSSRQKRTPRRKAALSFGERVSGDGAFVSRRWTGEGSLPRFAERAISNGKWQNSNRLQFVDFSNPKPFDLCHLPFDLLAIFAFTYGPFVRSAIRGRHPSPIPLRLMKTPAAGHPFPKGEGCPRWFGGFDCRNTFLKGEGRSRGGGRPGGPPMHATRLLRFPNERDR